MAADNPEAQGTMPFAQLGLLLKTPSQAIPTIDPAPLPINLAPLPIKPSASHRLTTRALGTPADGATSPKVAEQAQPNQEPLLKRKAPDGLKVKLKIRKVTSQSQPARRASRRLAGGS
ncbi:hypothetical protein PSHT_14192 [Puccinia striiformis]|uniref:Uncharacterized protein n=1 Tax=Puccinia striiformis TaxID=27350 RepID=A0A2S4ULF0_9BASI|nr:hypothetical protein PSHT_14192 [Puccinia striiformis]